MSEHKNSYETRNAYLEQHQKATASFGSNGQRNSISSEHKHTSGEQRYAYGGVDQHKGPSSDGGRNSYDIMSRSAGSDPRASESRGNQQHSKSYY